MTHSWIRLAGSPDPALQAYVLRNLTLADPDAVVKNMRGVLDLLKGFEAGAAVAVLRDFHERGVPGLSRLLLHLLWEDPRPEVQAPALHLLGRQEERDDQLAEILRLRKHLQAPRAVSSLVSVLGKMGRDLPFKVFKPYLSHPDSRVRANAIEAMLDRLHPRLGDVFAMLANDTAPRVRALSALALWRLGKPLLASLLEESEETEERTAVAHAAGRAGQAPRLANALVAMAGNAKVAPQARLAAARSLATAAAPADVSRILALAFKAEEAPLRQALVESSSAIDAAATNEFLQKVLAKLEPTMRSRQIASTISLMGLLPSRPEPAVLAPYVEHPDNRIAANAVEVLGKQASSPAVAATLARALKHSNGRVAANAALALWKQGFVAAFARLREMARDTASGMRASAAWAFAQAGGLLAQDAARPLLEDSDERVRRWAFVALQ